METNTKLERFIQQTESAAQREADKLIADAQAQAVTMINDDRERMEARSAMLARISRAENDERKRVAESRYVLDRKVLTHRNALVNGLFDDIRSELVEFTRSQKYEEHLVKCVDAANRERSLSDPVFVYCRKADAGLAEKVLKKYGIIPKTDRNILIGGLMFKYPVKGIFIDLTLDSAFDAEREAFSSRSEMQL
ncbi:MAG: V-type ATP synthase subunit E [Ruminiclostridium sp.]|nr:V-type ATP synthase subunit E [Ruminiclostridium sp.]